MQNTLCWFTLNDVFDIGTTGTTKIRFLKSKTPRSRFEQQCKFITYKINRLQQNSTKVKQIVILSKKKEITQLFSFSA